MTATASARAKIDAAGQKKTGSFEPGCIEFAVLFNHANALCQWTFLTVRDLKFDALVLIKLLAETASDDFVGVDEHILRTVVNFDEPVPFARVEPFHGTS